MKRILVTIILLLKCNILFSQETLIKNTITQKDMFAKGYILNNSISNKLSLQNGLLFSNYGVFNQLEIPILLKHRITDKWSVLFGSQLSTITNYQSKLLERRENGFKNFDVSIYLGTEYQLSGKVLGKLSLKYTILRKQNNSFESVEIDDNPLKFNVGVKF